MIVFNLEIYLLNIVFFIICLNKSFVIVIVIVVTVQQTNYGNPKVYTNGIKVKPYRLYKQGTQIQDISKPILHNHQNHMTGSTVNNTGKDN